MANNWKYATLGQRERLSEIRKGNDDMYSTEKARNKLFKEQQVRLGIPTTDIDDWDATIDNAYNKAKEQAKNKALPKLSGKYTQINGEMYEAIENLRKQRDESLETAKNEAESALDYLAEWLANNGYSSKGRLATESREEINSAIEEAIDSIKKEYDALVKSTVDRYFAMASQIFRRS